MNGVYNLAINGFIKKGNLFSKNELMDMSKSVDILLQSTKAVNELSTAFFSPSKTPVLKCILE